MKKKYRITIGLAAVLLLLFSWTAAAEADTAITDWDGLKSAIQSANDGATLTISGKLTAESNITITDKKITLVAGDENAVITRGNTLTGDAIFTVKSSKASLTLGQQPSDSTVIILDGASQSINDVQAPLIYVYDDAQLTLQSGKLQNNYNSADSSSGKQYNSGGGVYVGAASRRGETSSRFTMNGGTLANLSGERTGGGVFVYREATFEMNGGTFRNCSAVNKGKYNNTPYGGGIYAYGGHVIIKGNSQFIDCTTGDKDRAGVGGAISAQKGDTAKTGTLQISGNVSFSGKEAAGGPSSIYADGLKTLSVDNATFSDLIINSAIHSSSSAIQVSECETAVIKNSTFTNCQGSSTGGALLIQSDKAVIENCTFTNCSARNGSGIYFEDDSAKVINTTFTHCAAQNDGGAIYVGGKSQITMEGVTIDSCTAPTGGGIFVSAAGISETDGTAADTFLTMDDQCVITQCHATGEGGGIYIERRGQVRLDGAKITGCAANAGGGIFGHYQDDHGPKNAFLQVSGGAQITGNTGANVYFEHETQSIEVVGDLSEEAEIGYSCKTYSMNRIIAQRTTGQLTEADAKKFVCDTEDWTSAVSGEGHVILTSKGIAAAWSQLAARIAAAEAGTADNPTVITVSGHYQTTGTIDITNKHIRLVPVEGDVTISRGSGQTASFFTVGAKGSLTLGNTPEDTAFITLDGGGEENCSPLLSLNGGDFTLNAGLLTNNKAAKGGAVYIYDKPTSHFMMNGGTISDCTTDYYGGAVFMYKGGGISLKGGTISNCEATSMGGAVMAWEGQVDMSGGLIEECKAPNGGGIYIYLGASMTMSGGTIANCSGKEDTKGVKGGGIRIHNANGLTMTGGTVVGCSAQYGGGLYTEVAQSVTLEGGTISACQAEYGGAIYAYAKEAQTVTMKAGTLTGCTASASGGAVYAAGANNVFTMIDGTISQCTANNNGGAIYMNNGAISLSGGTIDGCKANLGGAIMLQNGKIDMVDGTILQSTATSYGGAIYMRGGGISMGGGTIDGCEAQLGGGIMAWGGEADIRNGLIKNCAAENGGGMYIYEDTAMALSGGTIEGCRAKYDGGGVYYAAGTLAMAGDGVVKDNLAATAGNLAASNIYLEDGCVLEISGALANGAIIGVSCADPADDRVIARGSGGYSLTASDAEKFLADFADYQVGLNDAGQAVLQKVVSFNVAVEKEGQGEITCVYAGLGEAVITLTPAEGFKLTALYVGDQQVPEEQIKPDETDLRSSIYTFTPTANVVVKAVFQAVSGEDLNDKIETVLPDLDDPLEPEEIDTILELKAEYEALPAADKKQINADKLHEALGAIDSISVVVVNAEGVPAKVAEPNALLYEMSYDEAMMLKTGKITEYKLIVTVNALGPFAVTQE